MKFPTFHVSAFGHHVDVHVIFSILVLNISKTKRDMKELAKINHLLPLRVLINKLNFSLYNKRKIIHRNLPV